MQYIGPTRNDLGDWPNGPSTQQSEGVVEAVQLEGPMLLGTGYAEEGWFYITTSTNLAFAIDPITFAALYRGA